ncbi:unnamed protein product [Auanema sp. JU1783]|nr:unnamed protein product [Auanema sp. JU1783]
MWSCILIYLLSIYARDTSANHVIPNGHRQKVIEALINESLRSHQVTACDGEKVTLHCPRNTHIMVEAGFYGRVVPESQLCPSRIADKKSVGYDSSCDVIQAHSKLSEICDKKRKCNVYVDTTTFEDDPCPSTSKYLQMSYKCRPISYDSESFCSDTEMHLECREGRRLAIYSATYGRQANSDNSHCSTKSSRVPQKECLTDVLPSVIGSCHAQESCTLHVSDEKFKNPCPKDVSAQLNILFMCLNEEIFSEDAINGELQSLLEYKKYFTEGSGNLEMDKGIDEEEEEVEGDSDVEEWENEKEDFNQLVKEDVPDIIEEVTSDSVLEVLEKKVPEMNNDAEYDSVKTRNVVNEAAEVQNDDEMVSPNLVGVVHDILLVGEYLKQNKEKVLVCFVFAVVSALILILTACIIQKCSSGSKSKSQRKPKRVRYSIERSQLLDKGSPYSMLGGPLSLPEMGDPDTETFFRYSISTPPRSTHYDF